MIRQLLDSTLRNPATIAGCIGSGTAVVGLVAVAGYCPSVDIR